MDLAGKPFTGEKIAPNGVSISNERRSLVHKSIMITGISFSLLIRVSNGLYSIIYG